MQLLFVFVYDIIITSSDEIIEYSNLILLEVRRFQVAHRFNFGRRGSLDNIGRLQSIM